ncbi:nucleotidyltransferase family protein [Thalassobacillus hwangdonensis]|uniref:Nucleotidyltransferase family protein n=1 Tax=Thalassobacillus hwangdonensis TaxID=546108 RepID=A0ABW3L3J9_9BACI
MKREIDKLFLPPDTSLRKTLEMIDASAMQIALVVNDKKQLLGTVTDGDIRRGIIQGHSLDLPVEKVMNRNPITASIKEDKTKLLKMMGEKRIHHIPLLDDERRVVGVETLHGRIQRKDNIVVLMAGGLGTRLRPLTDDCPKPMLPVGGKPLLETMIERLTDLGYHRFYVMVNYLSSQVIDYFGDGADRGISINYIKENKRLGTAGALSLIEEAIHLPIIVMNGDILTKVDFNQLVDFHTEGGSDATMCVRGYDYQVPYGVVEIEDDRLVQLHEKPIQHFFVSAGIYVLNPEVIRKVPYNTFYDITELFEGMMDHGQHISVFPIREYWMDIGKIEDYQKANEDYKKIFTIE